MKLISAQPGNNAGKPKPYSQRVIDKTIKPIANTAVDYGKLLATSAISTPMSLGSFLALKANQPKLSQNLAQGAVNVRNAGGYNRPGVNDFTKGLGVTAKAVGTTYGLANAPRMVASMGNAMTTAPVKQAVQQVPQMTKRIAPITKMITQNGRDFFTKGKTPTYELGMPTRVFGR